MEFGRYNWISLIFLPPKMFTKIISGCSAQIFKMLRQHYHTGKYSLMQTTRTFEYFCTKCVYVCFVSYENHMFIGRRIFSQLKSSLTESYSKRAAAEKLKWNPNICKIILFFPLIWRNNKLKQSWWVAANDLILILCVQRTKIIAGRVNIFWTEFFPLSFCKTKERFGFTLFYMLIVTLLFPSSYQLNDFTNWAENSVNFPPTNWKVKFFLLFLFSLRMNSLGSSQHKKVVWTTLNIDWSIDYFNHTCVCWSGQ